MSTEITDLLTTISNHGYLNSLANVLAEDPETAALLNEARNVTFLAPTDAAFNTMFADMEFAVQTEVEEKRFLLPTLLIDDNDYSLTGRSALGGTVMVSHQYVRQISDPLYENIAAGGHNRIAKLAGATNFTGGTLYPISQVLVTPDLLGNTIQATNQSQGPFDYYSLDVALWRDGFNLVPRAQIEKLVQAHVVPDKVIPHEDLVNTTLTTAAGQEVVIVKENGGGTAGRLNQTFGDLQFEITIPDIWFDRGFIHVIDQVLNPFTYKSTSDTESSDTTAGSTKGSSSETSVAVSQEELRSSADLSTGAKAGIGVGVAAGVIAAILLIFFVRKFRRSKDTTTEQTSAPDPSSGALDDPGFQEKSELQGGPFNPEIAGPVKRKGELENGAVSSTSPLRSELPTSPSASELEEKPSLLARAQERSDSKPGGTSSDESKSDSNPTNTVTMSTKRNPVDANILSQSIAEPLPPDSSSNELAEEFDLLVSELGILVRRKKALRTSADASGVPPEEVEGRKGEDYRELDTREQRLRSRLSELQASL
ncbi:hypothetical protein LTR84_003958 [Exophiala bonariae]|uniref:FAS1 domain-containing protein n=1 Tax=Exophiala bonariae TaxID=1690606 RepID=A0AAV9N4V4_9EURO|nr:hypothetical protein LTR84_003958 [Exophiala bonariae]